MAKDTLPKWTGDKEEIIKQALAPYVRPLIAEPNNKAWRKIVELKGKCVKKGDFEMAAEWRRIERIAFPEYIKSIEL
jgi:hypothetical protein